MSQITIATAEEKLAFTERIRNILFDGGYPDYGLAIGGFNAVCPMNPEMCRQGQIGCTDYQNMYLNPYLSDEELSLVARHEILHVLLNHKKRCGARNRRAWNYATDYEISNYYGVADQMTMARSPALQTGLSVHLNPAYKNMTADEIYPLEMARMKAERNENSAGQDETGGQQEGEPSDEQDTTPSPQGQSEPSDEQEQEQEQTQGNGQESPENAPEAPENAPTPGSGDLDEESFGDDQSDLRASLLSAVENGYDGLSEDEKEQLAEKDSEVIQQTNLDSSSMVGHGRGFRAEPKPSPAKVKLYLNLRHYFIDQQNVDKGKSYRRPNKKYIRSNIIMKGRSNVYKETKTVAVYVDVSGSMRRSMIEKALGVVEELKKIKRVALKIHYFDDYVYPEFEGHGGGTDYVQVLRHAQENQYTAIVIITDDSYISSYDLPRSDKESLPARDDRGYRIYDGKGDYVKKEYTWPMKLDALWLVGIEPARRYHSTYFLDRYFGTKEECDVRRIVNIRHYYHEIVDYRES